MIKRWWSRRFRSRQSNILVIDAAGEEVEPTAADIAGIYALAGACPHGAECDTFCPPVERSAS